MSLLKRIKNIIRSNLNFEHQSSLTNYDNYASYGSGSSEQVLDDVVADTKSSLEAEYYGNLELPYGAGFDEIKKQYRKLLKKYHPDKFNGNKEKQAIAQDVVKKLNLAYSYFEEKYKK